MLTDDVIAHYKAAWGQPSRTADFDRDGYRLQVFKWSASQNPEGVTLYATCGLSAYALAHRDLRHRIELYVGLEPAVDDVARSLALLALVTLVDKLTIGSDHTVQFPEPLWPGTAMRTFLISPPTPEILSALSPREDGLHVDFHPVIPIFDSELQFKRDHSADDLIERWRAHAIPYWNPNREADPRAP